MNASAAMKIDIVKPMPPRQPMTAMPAGVTPPGSDSEARADRDRDGRHDADRLADGESERDARREAARLGAGEIEALERARPR